MGLATLNVWIHDKQDPCKISDEVWWVAVTYCNGNPVEWCGHTYSFEEAKCGHAELRLPPGSSQEKCRFLKVLKCRGSV